MAGTGRVGSRPAGYERGSAFLILKREVEETKEEALSLCPVELENVEPIENRDRHDEPDDDVEFVAVVLMDANDEIELRPVGYQLRRAQSECMTYETRVFAQTSSGSSAEDVSTAELRCVASTPLGSRHGLPSYK
jgi:hypothetical protein